MSAPLRCLVVDDEPLARERLALLLAEAGGAEVVGEAADGRAALAQVAALAPDVVFLDVEMPGLGGFDVVDLLPPARWPAVVFVTAFDAYAVRAFDVSAVDYLTKPVQAARLRQTLDRLRAALSAETPAPEPPAGGPSERDADAPVAVRPSAERLDRLTLSVGRRLVVVPAGDVARFEAEDKTTLAHPFPGAGLAGRPGTVEFTLDALGARLDGRQFVRVHRSVLVNVRAVRELVPWFSGTYRVRLVDGAEVPLARRRVSEIRALLGG